MNLRQLYYGESSNRSLPARTSHLIGIISDNSHFIQIGEDFPRSTNLSLYVRKILLKYPIVLANKSKA